MVGASETSGLCVQVIHSDDEIMLISLQGRLRMADAVGQQQLEEALVEHQGPWVALDISRLHHIDSTGLSVLIGLHKSSSDRGVRVSLLEPSEPISAIFRQTSLSALFEIIEGPEADLIRQRS